MLRPNRFAMAFLAIGSFAANAQAGISLDLFRQVPAPPADEATALRWWKDGKLGGPEIQPFLDQLEKERSVILDLNGGHYPVLEPLSPGDDAPAVVQDISAGYQKYLARHGEANSAQAQLGKRSRWLQAAMGGRLSVVLKLLKPCAVPCEDADIVAHNAPHQAEVSRLVRQDLVQWGALFADWKQKREPIVLAEQPRLEEADKALPTLNDASKSLLARYRAAMLSEVEALLSITETAVRRTFSIGSGEVDAVTGPSRSASAKAKN